MLARMRVCVCACMQVFACLRASLYENPDDAICWAGTARRHRARVSQRIELNTPAEPYFYTEALQLGDGPAGKDSRLGCLAF